MLALATTSSAVTLPTALKYGRKAGDQAKRVSKLVLSLGMSPNSKWFGNAYGVNADHDITNLWIELCLYEYVYIALLTTLSSLANAVVPGAGLVSLAIVMPQMGLPLESIALFAGVEWFVGMLRTILNVDSTCFRRL